jgi:hypothetical protein
MHILLTLNIKEECILIMCWLRIEGRDSYKTRSFFFHQ